MLYFNKQCHFIDVHCINSLQFNIDGDIGRKENLLIIISTMPMTILILIALFILSKIKQNKICYSEKWNRINNSKCNEK